MRLCMIEGKTKRGQRLATAGRYRQREQASFLCRTSADMVENIRPQPVDGRRRAALVVHISIEGVGQPGQDCLQCRPITIGGESFNSCEEPLGVDEIGIDQTGED